MLKGQSRRGFASMDPEKQREIASLGGKRAHEKGTAHQFNAAEASAAGKKGGATVSQDRQHMADIGRLGGKARGAKAQNRPPRPPMPDGIRGYKGGDSAFVPPALEGVHGMDLDDTGDAPLDRSDETTLEPTDLDS